MMHANEDAIRVNEVPLDLPIYSAEPGFDDMHIYAGNDMVRATLIISTASPTNNGCHVVWCNFAGCEQVFNTDIRSLSVQNPTTIQTG